MGAGRSGERRSRDARFPAADRERFEAWASAPAKAVPELEALAAFRPVWQD